MQTANTAYSVRWADLRNKVFSRAKLWGRIRIDSQSSTIAMNLAEDAAEYGALERLKIVAAHITTRSHQTFLVNSFTAISASFLDLA